MDTIVREGMSRTRGAQSGVSGRVTVSVLYLVLSLAFNQGLKVLHLLVVLYPVFLKPIYSLFRKTCGSFDSTRVGTTGKAIA